MKIAVVIRTLNEGKYLAETLKSLVNQAGLFTLNIIIVDSGSTDNTKAIARSFGAQVIDIAPKIWSWGRSLNIGIEKSDADVIFITSGHCILASNDFIQLALAAMDGGFAAVYGRQIPIAGFDPFEEWELREWYPAAGVYEMYSSEKLVGVSNACCMLKKSVWRDLKFDEDAQSMEDGIWAVSALEMGYKLKYSADFSLKHSHVFNIEYSYKKWFYRTLEGLCFDKKLNGHKRSYKIKYSLKSFLLLYILCFRGTYETCRIAIFLRDTYIMQYSKIMAFQYLKYHAIYSAYISFKTNVSKSYINQTLTGCCITKFCLKSLKDYRPYAINALGCEGNRRE